MLAGSGRESENAHLHQYNITITITSSLSTSATTGSPSYPALRSFCSRQHEAADGSLRTLTEQRGRVVRTGPGENCGHDDPDDDHLCAFLMMIICVPGPGENCDHDDRDDHDDDHLCSFMMT